MIEVVNRKYFSGNGIYIGRAMNGIKASPLANPYKVKPHGSYERSESVALYRRWLWNEVKSETGPAFEELCRLVELARHKDLHLVCWCKQLEVNVACHGDIIRCAIEWMLVKQAGKNNEEELLAIVNSTPLLSQSTSANNEIRYVQGDATEPQGEGNKIIAHCCNSIGAWKRGFVTALSRRWMQPEREYRRWHRQAGLASHPFGLGQVQMVQVSPTIFVANLIGQEGIYTDRQGLPPVRYASVRQGLARVAQHAVALNASLHMPRLGAGLAGGDWETIARIIEEELCARGISVTVYDFPKKKR